MRIPNENRPGILFIVHCTAITPSTKRRVIDHLVSFDKKNIDYTILSYTSPYLYKRYTTHNYKNGSVLFRLINTALHVFIGVIIVLLRQIKLIQIIALAPFYRVIFIQKAYLPSWFSSLLKRLNSNIIYDLDDALFLIRQESTKHLIRNSRIVFCGSHYLLDYAHEYNANSFLIPTPVPSANFALKSDYDKQEQVTIGWIGSAKTLKHLEIVAQPLDYLAQKYPSMVFRIIGFANSKNEIPHFNNLPLELIPSIPYKDVPHAISKFDIGLMPLIGDEWDKGKCAGKALEYMAAGVPCVASDFGENPFVIKDGDNGFLANSEDDWVEKIELLILNPDIRKEVGIQGRETVLQSFDTVIVFSKIHELMTEYCLSK